MTIRWRLVTFGAQLALILAATYSLTGSPFSPATWYGSLVALAINSQLLEPFFPRPVDVLGNSVVGLVFYAVAPNATTRPAWNVLAIALTLGIVLSATALVLGANKIAEGKLVALGRASRVLTNAYSAGFIYSALFWLGLLDVTGGVVGPFFWSYAIAWLGVVALGSVNWQAVWATARGGPVPATPEGLIGPSKLLVAGPAMPPQGTTVSVSGGGETAVGTVLSRVPRASDVWAAIHLDSPAVCERLVGARTLTVTPSSHENPGVLGIVDKESTNSTLVFSPTRPLRIGDVVAVASALGSVLYQVVKAEVVDLHVNGGGYLTVKARASQLGLLQVAPLRLARHRWVPDPGAAVSGPPSPHANAASEGQFLLGHLIGTQIPIYMNCDVLCEGHLAILGMTRMGKTTLAIRLAQFLSDKRAVIVMDQTGEYRTKQGFPIHDPTQHGSTAGVSVFEPAPGKPTPDEGLAQLKRFANAGYTEYKTGTPYSRVLLIDEAHQFVPEPALLGFGAPGRESAITFGMHAMQVRKYGITLAMISQRTAVVAKTALSQCENVIAFKSVDQTGLDYLEAVLGPQARDILPNLQQGEALVCGPAVSSDYPVAVTLSTSPIVAQTMPVTSAAIAADPEGPAGSFL